MRPKTPRIPPLDPADYSAEQKGLLGGGHRSADLNIVRTLVQHPKLFKAWSPFSIHIMMANSLSPRDREILILRAGFLCRSAYEVAQHSVIARQVGLSDEDIKAIEAGPRTKRLNERERLLLKAADELIGDHCIADATWAALSKIYSREQLMDLVFTVANYTLVSMALNSFGVQIEGDVESHWKDGL